VAEFCIAEFALAVGLSTDSGRKLIADAVELKYRLPKVWSRVWSSPHGYQFFRNHHGTLDVSRDCYADPPDHQLHCPRPRHTGPRGVTSTPLAPRFGRISW
jgi:hypothetical protein